MKVLFITRDYLSGHGGGVYATRAYINAFANVAEELTLVYPYKKGLDVEGVSNNVTRLYKVGNNRSLLCKFIRTIMGRISVITSLPEEFFDRNKYDIVVFNLSGVSQGLIMKFKSRGFKIITIHHNFELEYLRDNVHKLFYIPQMLATYFVERRAVLYSDLNFALTIHDVNSLVEKYNADINSFEVIGVFESTSHDKVKLLEHRNDNYTFILTGDLRYPQSYQSLLDWMDDYYPILKHEVAGCHVVVSGREPSKQIVDKCQQLGIELIPSPKDMNDVLVRGDFYICPTNMGSGLKLRILDGLKYGMHVISHEKSVRGYERLLNDGIVFSYNNKESFRTQLRTMLNSEHSKQDVQNRYHTVFSFEAGLARLQSLLKKHKYNL